MCCKTINFEEYQTKVLELYAEVNEILTSLGIKNWGHSGTLLGIIRHDNDFIPWDDDIDLMVLSKEWESNLESIIKKTEERGLHFFDFKFIDTEQSSDLKFAKIFSKETYNVEIDGVITKSRPFIDIFFAVPTDSFDKEYKWSWYRFLLLIQWTTKPGFNRYLSSKNKVKSFIMNLISYPVKLVFWEKKVSSFLDKPFKNYDGDWNTVRRCDKWLNRKVIYNINEGLIDSKIRNESILINKNYIEELIKSYGENWSEEKKVLPHIIDPASTEFQRNDYIEKKINEKTN